MKQQNLSTSEENYLKAIYKISEQVQKNASTNAIANSLDTSAASVTDMLRRLAGKKLINYEKYKGVSLTTEGIVVATQLIRNHRLWEVFLVKKLRFSWGKIHDIAEQLEHIKSDELIMRLDAYLDFPRFDPHGDPIPNANGKFTIRSQVVLSEMHKGQEGILVGVKEQNSDFLKHLNSIPIKVGTQITVVETNSFDGSMKIELDSKKEVTVSKSIVYNLIVKKK